MRIIDTHAHLDHLENLEEALGRAVEAGVKGIVAVSMDLASCKKNLAIKRSVENIPIFLAMGMHPSEANLGDLEECVDLIRDNVEELTAIGEVGLDFWYKWVKKDEQKKEDQRKVFQRFLDLAKELDLPIIIHSRGAWKECLEMAKSSGVKKAEFHWYSGPTDVLAEIMAEGYYASVTPSVAYSLHSREAMIHAPIEQTLVETDTPVYYRNKEKGESFQSEPKDVFKTLEAYCALKNIKEKEALEILNQNAEKFFNLKGIK